MHESGSWDLKTNKEANLGLRKYSTQACVSRSLATHKFYGLGQVTFISLGLCVLICKMRKLSEIYGRRCTFILTMNFIFILCD